MRFRVTMFISAKKLDPEARLEPYGSAFLFIYVTFVCELFVEEDPIRY